MSNDNVDPISEQWHHIIHFTSKTETAWISAVSAKQPIIYTVPSYRQRIHINKKLLLKLEFLISNPE
jgi:hypothetical protein